MNLAKEASERASRSLKEKLDITHIELENRAKELVMDDAKAYKNYKILVESAAYRSELLTLDLEIGGLQNYQKMHESNVLLKPFCCFIRGMKFHLDLEQHFKEAIKYWKLVKETKDSPDQLKIMTLYWIGYEYNNMMEFENAAASFEEAIQIATGAQKYEQERMMIEANFFNSDKYSSLQILPEIQRLKDKIMNEPDSAEFRKIKSKICGTLGNVYVQIANELRKSGDNTEAERNYSNAYNTFDAAPEKDKWIYFGIGETLYRLNEKNKATEIFEKHVLEQAEREYTGRIEPRTKVLGQTTQLICSIWIKERNINVNSLKNSIIQAVGPVDDRLSIYSQNQRRNVTKKQFLEVELEEIMSEFKTKKS